MNDIEALNTFKALSQDSRWDIVNLIADKPGCCAKEISLQIGIPPSTLSFHLKQLVDAEILQANSKGRETYYRMRSASLEKAVERLQYLLSNA